MGTTTLQQVVNGIQMNMPFAAEGPSVEMGNQFIITEDNVEVIDLLLVRARLELASSHGR